jgi:CheY-like chemotaxis protein
MTEKHVLVVDDSRSARFAMRKFIERYRYAVDTAESGTEALGYLKDHRPLVVFLDHLMPGATGLEVLRTLKSDPSTVMIPVVICTSVDRPDFWEEARQSGAVEVIQKPPGLQQLKLLLEGLERNAGRTVTVAPVTSPAAARPPPVPTEAEPYLTLRAEISDHLRRLTDEIFVHITELKQQVARIQDGELSAAESETLRQLAREEAEALQGEVHNEIHEVRRRLDTLDLLHRRDRDELMRSVQQSAAAEAKEVAERSVTDAVSRLSHKLSEALLRAMGRLP